MKIGNTTLIPQNIAPSNAKGIAILDGTGKVICKCDLGSLVMPSVGTKKYTVGLLSDTHTKPTSGSDSVVDLTRAVQYFAENANIMCTSGDLADVNDNGGLGKHKEIVDANRGNLEVYEMPGNHEHYSASLDGISLFYDDDIKQYTGYPLYYMVSNQPTDEAKRNYYSPTVGNDVFIMCGSVGWTSAFNDTSIRWLYEVLEANRNKRCFLFLHAPLEGAQYCGDALNVITWDHIGGYISVFVSLLKHYRNVIYFHGHTHAMLEMQDYLQGLANPLPANYDFANGIHSVHIPSTAISRDISSGNRVDVVATSQGYLMDVYENHIVLRGRDFVKGEFIPIAQYCLDTTQKTVESKPASYFGI